MRLPIIALVVLLAAGCAAPADPPAPDDPNSTTTPAPPATTTAPTTPTVTTPAAGAPSASMRAAHESSWLCQTPITIDDVNTSAAGGLTCSVKLTFNETHVTIATTGVPNHDVQSGPSPDKTAAQQRTWRLPLAPRMAAAKTMAPERGAIAVASNGAAIYGPEEGSGGAAVANHYGLYKEDRELVWLGVCDGHSGPNGEFHYHADANCMHWHPGAGEDWLDYSWDKLDATKHSGILGWAFDGYPIYGSYGYDELGNVVEIESSYQFKQGANGYNGIDDFEYVEGLSDLDECNGRFAKTPEFPEGTYAYWSTKHNGGGDLGFPHFLLCYKGVVETSNIRTGTGMQAPGGAGTRPPPPPGGTPPPPGGTPPPPR